jgi:hypothetical protein
MSTHCGLDVLQDALYVRDFFLCFFLGVKCNAPHNAKAHLHGFHITFIRDHHITAPIGMAFVEYKDHD